jgi:VanZ family protein
MHTFIETVDVGWRFWGMHKVQSKRAVQGQELRNVKRNFVRNAVFQLAVPAYPMERAEMRPVTRITIFGFRLAIVVLVAYWFCLFLGTHLPDMGQMVDLRLGVNDKVKHFSAFFLLGGLLCYVTNSPRWQKRFAIIGLVGMAYAAIDEITQNFIPGRYPDVLDFAADAAGLWTAIAIYVGAKYLYLIFSKGSPEENIAKSDC